MIDRNREGCLLTGVPFFEKRWGGGGNPISKVHRFDMELSKSHDPDVHQIAAF